jgi:anti-sigma regulatory factor (Ser/Thr protein kinase)
MRPAPGGQTLVRERKTVPNGPTAPYEARLVLDSFKSHLPPAVFDAARLVVSEVVTNTYKHSGKPPGTPIDVSATLEDGRLRIAVIDGSIFDPTPETQQELRAGRWGLYLVDKLSDAWGRISEGGIWAEFDTAP